MFNDTFVIPQNLLASLFELFIYMLTYDKSIYFFEYISFICPDMVDILVKKQCVVPFRFVDSAAGHLVTLKLF